MRAPSHRTIAAALPLLLLSALPSAAQRVGPVFGNQWGLEKIGAEYPLLDGYTGKGVGVVIIDGLFQLDHPQLKDNVGDFIYNPGGFAPNSHGTGVAGLIGAAGYWDNGNGMQGVAPDVKLNSIALFNGSTFALTPEQLAEGYNQALNKGLRIFNNSWGAGGANQTINEFTKQQAINWIRQPVLDALQRSVDLGAVQVWATMNKGQPQPSLHAGLPYLFPSLRPGWIAVTSVGENGKRDTRTNACGVAAQWCISAPGGNPNIYMTNTPNSYQSDWGTSYAAPQVTGAVAIAREMFPYVTGAELVKIVLRTGYDIGAPGVDPIYGWGLLNLKNLANIEEGGLGGTGNEDGDGDDNGAVFVNSAFSRFAAVDTMVTTLWDRSANRIMHQGGTAAPTFATAMASVPATPAMALGGPVRDDVDSAVMVSTGRSAAVWAQGLGAHASLDGSPKSSADLGGAIGGYDLFDNGTFSGGLAISYTQSNLDTKGTGDKGSAEGWHGFAYATYQDAGWFLDGIAGGNWFGNDYTRTTIGGTQGTVLGNQGITGYASNNTSGFAGRLTGGHVFGFGPHAVAPYAYATWVHQNTGGSDETGADIFSLNVNSTTLDQVEGGIGVRGALGGLAWHAFNISPSVDLAYGRLGGDVNLPVGFELLGNQLAANAADVGRNVLRVGVQLDVLRFDEMVGGFIAYDGRFQENAQNNTFSGGVLVRF